MDWIFQQQAGWKAKTGNDGWGPTYAPIATPIPCRWQEGFHRIKDSHGNEVVSQAQIWFSPEHDIKAEDILISPSGEECKVLTVKAGTDLWGNDMYRKAWC